MQKRYVYILIGEGCELIAVETSLKKIVDKHSQERGLLSYGYLAQKLGPAKRKGEDVTFTGKNGDTFKLAARRLQ